MARTRNSGSGVRKRWVLYAALVFSFLLEVGVVGQSSGAEPAGPPQKQLSKRTDFQFLEGRWVRPDGGYILELRNIGKDGSVTASYFNPRTIHVHRAKMSGKAGTIILFVELRDVNYPGSNYSLQYDKVTDRLKGKYFQAVERRTFNVEFMRAR